MYEELKTSSPMHRAALNMNPASSSTISEIAERQKLRRSSPRVEEKTMTRIKQNNLEVWDSPEHAISDIIAAPLLDLAEPFLASGRDILWSPKPLPQISDYPLVIPEIDRRIGFQPTRKSTWTRVELAIADHPRIRPYSQPTRETLFPSILFETGSEASGGKLYGAEAQLATAGAHGVISMLWILNQINPDRPPSSTDNLAISYATDERETVAHIHFYNLEDDTFSISYVDNFYLAIGLQACRDHVKNSTDWMLNLQQPKVRNALIAIHPITQTWSKG